MRVTEGMTPVAATKASRGLGVVSCRAAMRVHQLVLGVMFAACLAMAGCQPSSKSGSGEGGSTGEKPAPLPPMPPAPFQDWPQPRAVLLVSGEQRGYFEPCGCSLTQSGGLSRRADLIRHIDEKGWPRAAVDLGGSLKRSRRQDQIKFEVLFDSLKQLGYGAMVSGAAELRLGADFLLTLPPAEKPSDLQLVAANVALFDQPDLGIPAAAKVIQAGPVAIGVVSVVGESKRDEVAPAGVITNVSLTDPASAVDKALATLQPQSPELLVLLSHGTTDEAIALAEKFPAFKLVLATGGPDDPGDDPAKKVGDTLVWQMGAKGKYLGVVGLMGEGDALSFRFERVDLDNRRFQPSPSMEEMMRRYQERLQREQIAVSPELTTPDRSESKFVGAQDCGECHTKAFARWSKTKHAHAFDSLKVGRKGQEATWISRIHDPECLSCHVTGWEPQEMIRFASGYLDEASTPHLKGQQCENCHGAGSQHSAWERAYRKDRKSVAEADLLAGRKAMHRTLPEAKASICKQCHDIDNSPNFKFEKYWDEVRHPGRD